MYIEGNFKMPDSEILNIFVVDKLILNEGWKKVKICTDSAPLILLKEEKRGPQLLNVYFIHLQEKFVWKFMWCSHAKEKSRV